MGSIKKCFTKISNAKYALLASATTYVTFAPRRALADVNTDKLATTDMGDLVGGVIDFILDMFMYIGILLLLWACGMLFLAFKNEDADSKSRAMMVAVASIGLITLKGILQAVLPEGALT